MAIDAQTFTRGARANLLQGVKAAPREWRQFCEVVSSDTQDETYDSFNAAGRVTQDLGAGFTVENGVRYNYTITNQTFTLAIGVSRDALDDDKLGAFTNQIKTLGVRMGNHPFERAMTVLTTGDANAAFDSSNFFANSHNDFTTLDNSLTSVAAAADAVPTLAELEIEWAKITAAFLEFEDRSGANVHYDGLGSMWLLTGPQLKAVGRKMLNGALTTNGQTQIFQNDAQLMTLPANHMQDTSVQKEIITLLTNEVIKPLVLQERSAIADKTWENDTSRTIYFGAESRFTVGYGNPAAAIHHVFTT